MKQPIKFDYPKTDQQKKPIKKMYRTETDEDRQKAALYPGLYKRKTITVAD